MRNCLHCVQFMFLGGHSGYSEMTPGSDVEMYCSQGVWEFDACLTTEAEFLHNMNSAETCTLYEARPDEVSPTGD